MSTRETNLLWCIALALLVGFVVGVGVDADRQANERAEVVSSPVPRFAVERFTDGGFKFGRFRIPGEPELDCVGDDLNGGVWCREVTPEAHR